MADHPPITNPDARPGVRGTSYRELAEQWLEEAVDVEPPTGGTDELAAFQSIRRAVIAMVYTMHAQLEQWRPGTPPQQVGWWANGKLYELVDPQQLPGTHPPIPVYIHPDELPTRMIVSDPT